MPGGAQLLFRIVILAFACFFTLASRMARTRGQRRLLPSPGGLVVSQMPTRLCPRPMAFPVGYFLASCGERDPAPTALPARSRPIEMPTKA